MSLYLLEMLANIHPEVLTTGPPKQDLIKDDTNRHANMEEEQLTEPHL